HNSDLSILSFNTPATTEIYTLSLHDALPICKGVVMAIARASQPLQEILKRAGLTERIGTAHFFPTVRTGVRAFIEQQEELTGERSEEHTSELQSRGHLVCRLLLEKKNPLY